MSDDAILDSIAKSVIEIDDGLKNLNEHVNSIHRSLVKLDDRITRLERERTKPNTEKKNTKKKK